MQFRYLDLPLEIKDLALDYLDIISLVNLSEACRDARVLVTCYLHKRVQAILHPFGLDWLRLLPAMEKYRAVIGGLCALKAVVPAAWPFNLVTNSLYFYVPKDTGHLFVQELKCFGEFGLTKDGNFHCEVDEVFMQQIWSLKDEGIESPIFLHVIESIMDNHLEPIFQFPSTHIMNFITSNGIFVAYSALTSAAKGLVNYSLGGELERRRIQQVAKTHTAHGFTVLADFPKLISEGHVCGLDFSCPLTIRSTIDGGTTFVPIYASHPLKRGDENIDALVWSIGAQPCNSANRRLEGFIKKANVVPEYTYW